jgi:hypothetical protein
MIREHFASFGAKLPKALSDELSARGSGGWADRRAS